MQNQTNTTIPSIDRLSKTLDILNGWNAGVHVLGAVMDEMDTDAYRQQTDMETNAQRWFADLLAREYIETETPAVECVITAKARVNYSFFCYKETLTAIAICVDGKRRLVHGWISHDNPTLEDPGEDTEGFVGIEVCEDYQFTNGLPYVSSSLLLQMADECKVEASLVFGELKMRHSLTTFSDGVQHGHDLQWSSWDDRKTAKTDRTAFLRDFPDRHGAIWLVEEWGF